MKTLSVLALSVFLLNSCVFEFPFENDAKFPVEEGVLGRWEEVKDKTDGAPDRMLVLQNSPNEYVIEYPVGGKAMYFRAFAVELEGAEYMQIQLTGTAEGAAKPADRKYHLLKVRLDGDSLEMRTIRAELLGKDIKDSAGMKAAFKAHKDDADLFAEAVKFSRIK
jgi:hypothetical protein